MGSRNKIFIIYFFLFVIFPFEQITAKSYSGNRGEFSEENLKSSLKLTQYNGLSSPKIRSITRDFSGFIWIGTDNGINRYDAHGIKTYFNEDSVSGMLYNHVNCLFQSSDSTLWAGTEGGLKKYDPRKDVFERIPIHKGNRLNQSINVVSFAENEKGDFWIGTTNGIFRYQNNSFTKPEFSSDIPKGSPVQLIFDQSGTLWIATYTEGIFKWNPKEKKLKEFTCKTQTGETQNKITEIQDITKGPDKLLWVATWGNGLWKLDPVNEVCEVFTHHENNINSPNSDNLKSLTFDPEGRLWIGYEEAGLDYFVPKQEKFYHFYAPMSKNARFEEPSVYEIFMDKELIMWLGFRNDGVRAFPLLGNPFSLHVNPTDADAYQVFCLHEYTENMLAAGVAGGIDILDLNTGEFKRFSTPNYETPVSISSFDNQNIIVATYNDNIYKFNTKTRKFSKYFIQDPNNSDYLNRIRMAYGFPGRNYFLIGSSQGLYKINKDNHNESEQLYNHWVHMLLPSGNKIWFTTYDGRLSFFDREMTTSKTYTPDLRGDIKAITKIQNTIIAGTDLGLYAYNYKTDKIKQFKNIFPYKNIQVNAIEKDDNTGIWCTSSDNLIHYDPVNEQFRTYDETDQLPQVRFSDGVSCKLQNGNIAFGGQGGIITFNPLNFRKQKNNSNVVFTSLKILNKTINPEEENSPLEKTIAKTKQLSLKNNQNTFTLNFSLLSYTNPSKHRFRYRLKGMNSNWIDLGNQNQISFTNLRRGKYTLEVQAANQDNLWSDVEKLQIVVQPPFFLTWYAFVVYFLFAAILIVFILKVYKAREQARNEIQTKEIKLKNLQKLVSQENEFHQMKLKFFTNISHELRTPISLILAPLEKYMSKGRQPDKQSMTIMYNNAERLSNLVTQILDFRKIESGKLNLELSKGDITRFCRRKAMLFSTLAHKKNLRFYVNTPNAPLQIWFDGDKFEKIIFNLLSNAFKYTQKGSVTFSLSITENNTAKLSVADTGQGIPKEEAEHIFERFYNKSEQTGNPQSKEVSSGLGLSLTKELTEIHGGTITLNSDNQVGCEFIVTFPTDLEPRKNNKEDSDNLLQKIPDEEKPQETSEEYLQEKSFSDDERPNILVVEDNADLRDFIKKEFEANYNVLLACNGLEGLETARKNMPDVIISDIMMPEMDGIEMCEKIRNDKLTSHIPLIVLTAHESFTLKLKSFNSGIDDYITKPFSPQLLNLKLRNLLKRRDEIQKKFSRDSALKPNELAISNVDESFLKKAMKVVQENLAEEDFNADKFAEEMAMSRVHLYRKLKSLTGESVSDFVKTIKLKISANLIKEKGLSIKETAYTVGFADPKYFSKCFKQQFGVKPTDYGRKETNPDL